MTPQKIFGLLLIVLGIPFGVTALDSILPMSYFVAVGLMMIFFGKERINDERVQQLKMKALYTAMSMGLGLTLLAYVLVRSYYQKLTPARSLHNVISAWDFLAGVLRSRWACSISIVGRMPGPAGMFELEALAPMKSGFPFLLLPLLLFVLLFELLWVRERSPEVAPLPCEKSESKPQPKTPPEKMPEEKPGKQAAGKAR